VGGYHAINGTGGVYLAASRARHRRGETKVDGSKERADRVPESGYRREEIKKMKIAARTSQITKHSLAGLTIATGAQDANSSLGLRASRVEKTRSMNTAISEGDTVLFRIGMPPIASPSFAHPNPTLKERETHAAAK
jgi:hypothetical protein